VAGYAKDLHENRDGAKASVPISRVPLDKRGHKLDGWVLMFLWTAA
jgi:hypothetical protein